MHSKTSPCKFYVTTPIYYVNAKPHLGTTYSTLLADVTARWNRIKGSETFFLTGTDEHGQKVAEAAALAGKTAQAHVDELAEVFKKVWTRYNFKYNHFIRTTDDYHVKAVQKWLSELMQKGDIYKATYEGWYDQSSEAFLTEKDLAEYEGWTRHGNIARIPYQDLMPGMVMAEDALAKDGAVLVRKDEEVSWAKIQSLDSFSKYIGIQEPLVVYVNNQEEVAG